MANNQIMEEIDKAMKLGKKEAYTEIYEIVSNMYVTDHSESLKRLLNVLHETLSA